MPLVVHFKRPAGWQATINIHYWDTSPADPATTWPGVAMTAEANDWFVYTFPTAEAASIVFNDGAGRQTGNLRRESRRLVLHQQHLVRAQPGAAGDPGDPRDAARAALRPAADGDAGERERRRRDLVHDRRQRALGPVGQRADSRRPCAIRRRSPSRRRRRSPAVGVNSAGEVGQTRTFVYTIDPNADLQRPEVAASHRNGTYAQPIDVVFTLTDNRPAPLVAYYTLDGSRPDDRFARLRAGQRRGRARRPAAADRASRRRCSFLVVDGAGNETRQSFYYNIGPVEAADRLPRGDDLLRHHHPLLRRRSVEQLLLPRPHPLRCRPATPSTRTGAATSAASSSASTTSAISASPPSGSRRRWRTAPASTTTATIPTTGRASIRGWNRRTPPIRT